MSKLNQIVVHTNNARDLARQLFDTARAGKLPTWMVDDKKGTRFTHTTKGEQWEREAWLSMVHDTHDQRVIRFVLQPPDGKTGYAKEDVEGVYLGRFVEMLVNRFGDLIARIEVDRG